MKLIRDTEYSIVPLMNNEEEDALVEKTINELETSEKNIRFSCLLTICENVFGKGRASGGHLIFKTPWQGDPRINLQKLKGNFAKPYQVRQVL